jgi:hypothetical protein
VKPAIEPPPTSLCLWMESSKKEFVDHT